MTRDYSPYYETHDLAYAEKSFYSVRIPVQHWQLRHYISTPEVDLLYFASRHDVYCLNTKTRKRKHIATLPFEARCTASGFGYVCVGGEDCGHFAVIKLDGASSLGRSMEVDTALPLDGWQQGQNNNTSGRRAASVKTERIGDEIVNSISIHRIQDEEAHLDDIVAVLTNNDRTVRTYSLPSGVETGVLDLGFAMNHATISPDGEILVAVGDDNKAVFFQRQMRHSPPQIHKPHNRLTSASIRWKPIREVGLHVSASAGTVCFFTTAWSPNGRLMALGSEGGYISVFDVDLLTNPDIENLDVVVGIVPGSRPDIVNPHPGAIRSIMFSPEPWDLLIWAEDQGRVCIGDLRTGLKSRQIISLDTKDKTLTHIAHEDVPADDVPSVSVVQSRPSAPRPLDELEQDFIRRYRHGGEDATSVNFATEYIEARRRQRQQRAEMAVMRSHLQAERDQRAQESLLDDDPRGLTAREQQVLESLRTARQREEARFGQSPGTVTYTSADMFHDTASTRSNATTQNSDDPPTRPISEILSSVQDSLPELSRTNASSPRPGSSHGNSTPSSLPPLISMQDSGRSSGSSQWAATTNSLVRWSDGSRLPRRRASVMLTPPASNSPSAASQTTRVPTASAIAAAEAEAEAEQNPWRTIEEHMSLARGPLFESNRSRLQESPSRLATPPEIPAPTSTSATVAAPPRGADLVARQSGLEAELTAERLRARQLTRQRDRLRSLRDAPSAAGGTIPDIRGDNDYPIPNRAFPSTWAQANESLMRRAQWQMRVGYAGGNVGGNVGVKTAGLAMSADGRVLWVACEEGIFEVDIRVKGRLFWPSMQPR